MSAPRNSTPHFGPWISIAYGKTFKIKVNTFETKDTKAMCDQAQTVELCGHSEVIKPIMNPNPFPDLSR